jgi:hypothetical protein
MTMTNAERRSHKRCYKLRHTTADHLAVRRPGYILRLLEERDGYRNPVARRETMVQARRWAQGIFWFYANASQGWGLPGGEGWRRRQEWLRSIEEAA